jgi:hypothetical protein
MSLVYLFLFAILHTFLKLTVLLFIIFISKHGRIIPLFARNVSKTGIMGRKGPWRISY